ncbi:probable ATP-dependent RNA helicase DDX43 [Hetaerina americana]|uniref:probable ATP-dependent RNA helicase DDX43 n=1 Tax=Hetaerina americana TaxID=62018 RepID=UPI003A7F2F0D
MYAVEENWDNPNSTPVQSYHASNSKDPQTSHSHPGHQSQYNDRGRGGRGGRRGGRGGDSGSWSGHWRSNTRNSDQGGSRRDNRFGNSSGGSQNWRSSNNEGTGSKESDSGKPVIISVQSCDVGKIIGKGGSKIRELQDESGASIKILQASEEDYGETTNVQLMGSEEAMEKAKTLITELTEKFYNRGSGGYKSSNNNVETKKNEYIIEDSEGDFVIDWDKVNISHEEAQKERLSKCPKMIKDFYQEDPAVANMTKEEVAEFRKNNNNIVVSYVFKSGTEGIPNPIRTFEECFAPFPEILGEIRKAGFEKPSPIQCQAWPVLLKGHDLIGIAQTGTGKTLAFLLPALIHIDNQPIPRSERGGPNVLVMAPTRELALQIEKEVKKYSYRDIHCVCVYGGGNRSEQMNIVNKGVEIIIATPGRLNDLIQAGVVNVTSVSYLVLDEADRMLDLGFEPQIQKVLLDVRPDRQTVMTSATWPEGIRRLAQSYMSKPMQVFVGTLNLAAVHSVTQEIKIIDSDDKDRLLYEFLLGMAEDDKVIVFVGKKMKADHISSDLSLHGVTCQCIHGNRDQIDREQALHDLKKGYVRILIATDVASRGIDIEDVTHIFNYDFPRNIEEYVHRVGRTGRAGRTGIAISLVTREDWSQAKELIEILVEAGQEVPDELHKMAERHDAWVQRKHEEKELDRVDRGGRWSGGRGRGGGGGRGGRGEWSGGGGSWSRGRRDKY